MFNINIETCRACGDAVTIIVRVEDPLVTETIHTHPITKDTSAEASRLLPCRASPQAGLFN